MSCEIFGGDPGTKSYKHGVQVTLYFELVHSAIVTGTSLLMWWMVRWVGGLKNMWVVASGIQTICFVLVAIITMIVDLQRQVNGVTSLEVKVAVFTLWAVFGIPLAVTYSVPYALASIYLITLLTLDTTCAIIILKNFFQQ